jgi:hypothetical protein
MKTTTWKTRWIGALVTLTLLAGLGAGTALAGEPTDLDGLYPDSPEHPGDPDDLHPDYPPLYPTDPLEDPCADPFIQRVLSFLICVVVH